MKRATAATVVLGLLLVTCSEHGTNPPDTTDAPAEADAATTKTKSATFTSADDFKRGEKSGLSVDPQGDLKMSSGLAIHDTPFIWIPNSDERTVSKIDTKTRKVEGTYPLVNAEGVDCWNPSRTTVDIKGNVWVGCRGTSSYKHRNEVTPDMVPETVDNKVVKLARKDGRVLLSVKVGHAPRALALDADNRLWIGCSVDDTVWAIDGDTGECIHGEGAGCKQPAIPVSDFPYGAAVDQRGHLWVVNKALSGDPNVITEIDTEDGTKLGQYGPYFRDGCQTLYGIAIDQLNNVWLGGWKCDDVVKVKGVAGVDPVDGKQYSAGDMLAWYDVGGKRSRGVAVDLDGNVWVAQSHTNTATKISNADGSILHTVNVGQHPIGVGIDAWGNAWVVNRESDSVHRINGLDVSKKEETTVGEGPYTYSDMLGMSLRTITHRAKGFAYWSATVDSGVKSPSWKEITWSATVPAGAKLRVRTRCAADEAELSKATWGELLAKPGPIACGAGKRYLQFEARFTTDSDKSAATPVLHHLMVYWE